VTAATVPIYDSAQLRTPLVTEFRNVWRFRALIRLLVGRDLTVRYKRSALGVWWTLLNPLLTMSVLWVVFSQVFRFTIPGVPFAVYLLSGTLLITFFAQGVNATGAAMVNNANVLSKVYVPAEVFAFSSGISAAVNFGISLIPLFAIQLVTGIGIPWTALLLPLPAILLLAFTIGVGLLVAAISASPVLGLTNVFISWRRTCSDLAIVIVPGFLPLIDQSSLFFLKVRGFAMRSSTELHSRGVRVTPRLGVWVFSRSWKNLVVLLW
jgi:ABC-2 type transport system permease protein